MALYITVFIASFLLLTKAGSMLVKSLTHLARLLKLSEYLIAFVLMSFATSIPELFIGVSSAIGDISSFSFGNILGANFINITLVIGLVSFFSNGIKVESKIKYQNFLIVFFIAMLPIFLAMDGMISRGDGIVLILFFIIYLIRLLSEREYFTKVVNEIKIIDFEDITKTFKSIGHFFLGLVILVASSALLVWSGKSISDEAGISLLSFGIVFVALGTALPELAFGIRAAMLKHHSMTIGNSVGSVAFNSAFIIGIVSIIRPIHIVNGYSFAIAGLFIFVAFFAFNFFVYRQSNISRKEGIILIALYFFFLVVQYSLQVI